MKKINIDIFDKHSILDAIDEISDYYNELEEKCRTLKKMLADIGVDVAKTTVIALPYSTGDLSSDIYSIYDEKNECALIVADSEHAVFVEFGTGVMGEGTYPNDDYYGIAEQNGWQGYYVGGFEGKEFTTKSGREGWITVMNDGKVRFTEGQEATHFMSDTGESIRDEFVNVVRQVFECD